MDDFGMPLAHLTLATRDVPATAEFFRSVFGWENTPKANNSAIDVEWLDIGNGQQLHVIGVPEFEISPFEREYGRHVAFFASALELTAVKSRLEERGIELVAAERPTPFERFFFKDPNGYVIEVIDGDAWRE
ncbi:MAG: catechol 2,3-dioxygenase-like lactoylglutathione lyase family enzyme [Verrucomicrobiales bacterium]|jgi:catechol 2,3-dioxygenase-like lactoylglutathione lyase family enzyme